jgi:hypothetical protein
MSPHLNRGLVATAKHGLNLFACCDTRHAGRISKSPGVAIDCRRTARMHSAHHPSPEQGGAHLRPHGR